MREPPLEIDADGVHARPRRTGHQWADLVLAVSAIEHGRTEAEIVTASTWPFLIFSAGGGPAHIESVVISMDGRPVHSAAEILARCCGLPAASTVDDRIRAGESSEGGILGVIPARERLTVIGMSNPTDDTGLLDAFDRAVPRLRFAVCYCSVLNRCWTTDLANISAPVRQCRPTADEYRD